MKKNIVIVIAILFSASLSALGQSKYFTRNGKVSFNVTAPSSPEKVEAKNEKANSVLDISSGQVEFAVLMKAFSFEKALMEEHFNENYVESDKFPKATFKGNIKNQSEITWTKDGTYSAKLSGKLTIHGITKDVETTGTFTVKGGVISAKSEFKVLLTDYGIEIPSLVQDKVSKQAIILVDATYELLKTS